MLSCVTNTADVHQDSAALWTTVKMLSVLASTVMTAALAIWIGRELGQEINAGAPGLGPRFVLAAVLLIPLVGLVMAHNRPTLFTSRPVWWSSPVVATASISCLYIAQSMMLSQPGRVDQGQIMTVVELPVALPVTRV